MTDGRKIEAGARGPAWTPRQRWTFRIALATTAVTFLLLVSGGQVTSYDVGMADPAWAATFWRDLGRAPWQEESFGLVVEHGHRWMGRIVGLLVIALAALLWSMERRSWLGWLGLGALAAVCVQGILGGLRVEIASAGIGRELALVHGVFGQICFGILACLAMSTSHRWFLAEPLEHPLTLRLRQVLAVALASILGLIVLGAAQRHLGSGFIGHAVLAAAWLAIVMWLGLVMALDPHLRRRFHPLSLVLVGLTVVQILLGIGAAVTTRLAPPALAHTPSHLEAALATSHQAAGALLLAVTLSLFLASFRQLGVFRADALEVDREDSVVAGAGIPILEAGGAR